VIEVSRDLVASLAPEEMALFRPVSSAFFEDPRRLSSESKDDMLGFGVAEVVTLDTPVVLSVVMEVITLIRSELARESSQAVSKSLEVGVRGMFRRVRGGHAPPPAVPGLTRDQLARVRSVAFEKARQGGIGEHRAQLLADATVGSLVLST
jgi:hypothetical protein